jgi:hypothetical protein
MEERGGRGREKERRAREREKERRKPGRNKVSTPSVARKPRKNH